MTEHTDIPSSLAATRPHMPRITVWGLAIGALGLAAWGARWLIQGEATVWTDTARHFYAEDATLGWVRTEASWVWLGLDGLGLAAGVVGGTLLMAFLAKRLFEKPRLAKVLRALALVGGLVCCAAPVLPAWAFVTGMPPAGLAIVMPDLKPSAPPAAELNVTARRWKVAESPRANIAVVRIEAGEETFDGQFAPITGTLEFAAGGASPDPATAVVKLSAPSGSLSTGVELRDSHAREYLAVAKFPTVELAVSQVVLAPDATFRAKGVVSLMGKPIPVDVSGDVRALDAKARAELGLNAKEALLAAGTFVLGVSQTPLERENFDSDRLVVTTRVVFVPTP